MSTTLIKTDERVPNSLIYQHSDAILQCINRVTRGDWKVLVCDEVSRKTLSVIPDDDILNKNIMNIEILEERREPNPDMDAIYFLSNNSFVIDCLLADLDRHRYRSAYLIWTGRLLPKDEERIRNSSVARIINGFEVLMIDFIPRETHLAVFRDPASFPMLYHTGCNDLVASHMRVLAQKIASVCITMSELPRVRYYMPPNPRHEASVLCTHLARFVQEEFDRFQKIFPDFPPKSSRPQGTLLITDRSMDIVAPLLHEFTYQAMAHDVLKIKDADTVSYNITINQGTADEENKDMELFESDSVWVSYRHRHMLQTSEMLSREFRQFLEEKKHLVDQDHKANVNTIKDMMADLPGFQKTRDAYTLHIDMADQCMKYFQAHRLPDVAAAEQTLATGFDEDLRKAKGILEQIVPLLDDPDVERSDRLRLIVLYILYRDGIITEDINRLLAHSQLPVQDRDRIFNLNALGALATRDLKDPRPMPAPLYATDISQPHAPEMALSRYKPTLKNVLEDICKGQLRIDAFPYVIQPQDPNEDLIAAQSGSLRTRGNWAATNNRGRAVDNRQRHFVFIAGGATYSESRVCYEVSNELNKDVYLITSHMHTPSSFLQQVAELSVHPGNLNLPMRAPRKSIPAHLLERPHPPPQMQIPMQGGPGGPWKPPIQSGLPQRPSASAPPTAAMGQMNLGAPPSRPMHSAQPSISSTMSNVSNVSLSVSEEKKKEKEKKKRHFFKK